jgi:hypothetical protein
LIVGILLAQEEKHNPNKKKNPVTEILDRRTDDGTNEFFMLEKQIYRAFRLRKKHLELQHLHFSSFSTLLVINHFIFKRVECN